MSTRAGFTLLETVITIGIIAVLAGLVFAILAPAREASRQATCVSNLRQIGMAVSMYRADYDGGEPLVGSNVSPAALGMPPPTGFMDILKVRIKNRRVLFCPDFRRHGNNVRDGSSYAWPMLAWGGGFGRVGGLADALARRGPEAVIVYCDWHHPDLDRTEPRWANKREIVLRFSGAVTSHEVPVRSRIDTW